MSFFAFRVRNYKLNSPFRHPRRKLQTIVYTIFYDSISEL